MKQRRLVKNNYTPNGAMCKECKYALPVDAKHNKYYCVKPDEESWIYYGEHACGKGEYR